MIFDAGHRIYTPVAWALMTGKTNECYWQVFNWISSVVQDLDPSYIGVYFELAFFTNVSIHFPEAKLIGCLFHFKQAIRRKMKKLSWQRSWLCYEEGCYRSINCHSRQTFEHWHWVCGKNDSNSSCWTPWWWFVWVHWCWEVVEWFLGLVLQVSTANSTGIHEVCTISSICYQLLDAGWLFESMEHFCYFRWW